MTGVGVIGQAGTCPMCAGPPVPGHNFCEACGRDLRADTAATWWSSTAPAGPCPACGGTELSGDGYCDNCGNRRGVGQPYVECVLDGLAAVTDQGRRKRRNEDAVAVARTGTAAVAVVSDGVSSSSRADEAAHASVEAAVARLLAELGAGADPVRATRVAAAAAATAAAALASAQTAHSPPSCTYVSAVVTATEVVVGWLGDSRAYWLADDPDESRCLTVDDSVDGALARWLGADADDTEPHLTSFRPPGPGRVLLCSDGLSRYVSEPAELSTTAPGPLADTARALNQVSLDAGGVDNIAIVIISFPFVPDGSISAGAST